MTRKQIKRRMEEAFDAMFSHYENEAEWWGNDEDNIWCFSIPSTQEDIKMVLNEEGKRVDIYYRKSNPNKTDFSIIEDEGWRKSGNYSW